MAPRAAYCTGYAGMSQRRGIRTLFERRQATWLALVFSIEPACSQRPRQWVAAAQVRAFRLFLLTQR